MRLAMSTIVLATAASTVAMTEFDQRTNVMIPLTKRSSWLKLDNSVDFDALHSHIESVDAKILRGLENYERNRGVSHSFAAKGTDSELLNLKRRAVGTAALTGHNDFVWYGTMTIGTPPQSFTVQIDTGSSDIFLPGPVCSDCSQQARWDPASLRTAEAKDSIFEAKFSDGATASGTQYTDNVIIAGLSADNQTVGSATAYSDKIVFPPDGILGMAFQSTSAYPASPFFETLVNERKVTEPVFSVKLTSDGGELYLGGTNRDLYEGEIIYTPVTVVGFWQVNIETIQGNQKTVLNDITAIVDTGCNVIFGDWCQVADLHWALGAKRVGHGFYSFPCKNLPAVSLDFGGGRTFQIPASILNLGPVETGSPDCFSGIIGWGEEAPSDLSKPPMHWHLGAVFLQSVYTVFDFGNQQVGFANLV